MENHRHMKRQALSLLTAGALTLSLSTPALAAKHINSHWAQDALNTWMGYGIIQGYEDGSIRPDNTITRAELSAVLDRIMQYQTQSSNRFSDLDNGWYRDAILGAHAAGIIQGYGDGTVKPSATITRQEAAVMFARVLELDTDGAKPSAFLDSDAIAPWAKGAVNAMAAQGYIQGDDGYFHPNDGMTRAQAVTILDRIFTRLYSASGTYSGNVDGSMVINAGQTTLQDMDISGDLILAEGIGDGHIILDNVTIQGRLLVRGGGENSVILRGDSRVSHLSASRQEGLVRVSVEEQAQLNTLAVHDRAQGVKIEGVVEQVQVLGSDATVTVTGTVQLLDVAKGISNIDLTVASEAKIHTLTTAGQDISLDLLGQLGTLNVADDATDTDIQVDRRAQIGNINASGTDTTVNISGTVQDMSVAQGALNTTVTVNRGSAVSGVTAAGTNTTIHVLGTLDAVTVTDTADRTVIQTTSGSKIQSVTTSGSGTSVQGGGTVSKVEAAAGATDTSVTTDGTRVENNSSESVSTNGGSVSAGSSGNSGGNSDADDNSGSNGSGDSTPEVPEEDEKPQIPDEEPESPDNEEVPDIPNDGGGDPETPEDNPELPDDSNDPDKEEGLPDGEPEVPEVPEEEDPHTHSYPDIWTGAVGEDSQILYTKTCLCEDWISPAEDELVDTAIVHDVPTLRAILKDENISHIYIAEGTYTLDAQIRIADKPQIRLTGLGSGAIFEKGETAWSDPSILKGDASLFTVENSTAALTNLTLCGAQHIEQDYGHGLNLVGSTATLHQVHLIRNAGTGMVVNGSTVHATGLYTSGNGWAGVNIDRNPTYGTSASFTFDETCTFGEALHIYSDKGGVTVDGPGYVELEHNGKYYWTKKPSGDPEE